MERLAIVVIGLLLLSAAGCDKDFGVRAGCKAAADSWEECDEGCSLWASCEAWVTDCVDAKTPADCLEECEDLDCDARLECFNDCYWDAWNALP